MATIVSPCDEQQRGRNDAVAWRLRSACDAVWETVTTVITIAVWEVLAHFRRPAAYVMLLAATLVASWNFSLLITLLAQSRVVPLRLADDPLAQFLGPNIFLVFSLMLIVPVVTMGMVADERRRGVWEAMLTTPVTPGQVLLGKFFAAWVAVVVNLLPWGIDLLALRLWPGLGLDFDRGHLIGGAIGLATISLTLCAVGIACTTICKAPFAASVATVSAMIGLLLLSLAPRVLQYWRIDEGWISAAERVACWEHLAAFSSGAIDPGVVCGHVTFSVFVLWIASLAARSND